MKPKTPTASGSILDKTTGVGPRKLESWIGSFIEQTENLEAPIIWRRWAAISMISAALEMKVWLQTSSPLYPNLYIMIVGHPGTGKTRTLRVQKTLAMGLSEFHVAPISMTFASLVDRFALAKRSIVRPGEPTDEFWSMLINAEEMGAFIHKWDEEMIKGLAAFYDPDPYEHWRR